LVSTIHPYQQQLSKLWLDLSEYIAIWEAEIEEL
jgi:hypothetical protein